MAKEKYENNKQDAGNSDAAVKPEPETLNTTDPQEHMDGPLSSLMKGVEDTFEDEDKNGAKEEKE